MTFLKKGKTPNFIDLNMIFLGFWRSESLKLKYILLTHFCKLMRKLILQIKENGGISYLSLESIVIKGNSVTEFDCEVRA